MCVGGGGGGGDFFLSHIEIEGKGGWIIVCVCGGGGGGGGAKGMLAPLPNYWGVLAPPPPLPTPMNLHLPLSDSSLFSGLLGRNLSLKTKINKLFPSNYFFL